jgi:hypothetical protein
MAKIENLDKLLEAADINSSIIDFDDFIGEVCGYGDNMDTLSEPQKLFYFNQILEREVNNGGFNQFFINSSGGHAHETVSSLKLVGAEKTASILQNAIEQFPNKIVPKYRDKRIEMVKQIKETASEVWEKKVQLSDLSSRPSF